jgi:predicted TIM-barrel fold metal-dependent hydrolase
MITRRQALVGGTLSGAAVLTRHVSDAFAFYKDKPATPVNFKVPSRACDTHFHIFDPRFPYVHGPDGKLIVQPPEPATVDEARAFHRTLHIERMVIVQSAAYLTDNGCALDALTQFGANARGISVIDPEKITDKELEELDRGGMRGVRINPQNVLKQVPATVKRLTGLGNWHIQLQASLDQIEKIQDQIAAAPFPISIEHFAGSRASDAPSHPGFKTLLNLLRSGKVYMKLSRIHAISKVGPPDYSDVTPLAREFIAANPERMLWGSDWPFLVSPPIEMGRIFNQLAVWAPTPARRQLILVDNPARLYHF